MNIERTRPSHGGHGDRGIAVLLRSMHDAVAQEATAQERLDQLTRVIAGHVIADVCSIYLRLPSDDLELYSTVGLKSEAVHHTRMKWGEGLVGAVAATQKPLVTADAPLHPAFAYRPETGEDALLSFLGVPLIRSGKSLGVLVIQNKTSRRYSDQEVEAAQAVATLIAEIAASGELFGADTKQEVGDVLKRPERLKGNGLVSGVAIGDAFFHEPPTPEHNVFADDTAVEAERLEEGLGALRASVDDMLASSELSATPREVLETYRLFAYDRGWKDRLRAAVFSGLTAEAAVEQVQKENQSRMSQARDPYLRERLHDLDDLSHRLLRKLTGQEVNSDRINLPKNAIILARMMGPADLLEYGPERVKGIVLGEGSATSHVAIVARALDIPLVTGVDNAVSVAHEGDRIVVDGDTGDVEVRPSDQVTSSYVEKQALQSEQQAAFAKEKLLPTISTDDVEVTLAMNAGLALDMKHLGAMGAAGIGLFRTELQFLIGPQLPRVGAQQKLYREILDLSDGKPVIFRTADLGADKYATYMKRREEANPAMGWRGVRMAVDRPGILRPQLRALIGAAAERDLYILIPLVTLPRELDAVKAMLDKEVDLRIRRGHSMPNFIKLGAMIETPAAAFGIEAIADKVDFLSIGGNDLAQFFFASDRDSELTQVRYDPLERSYLAFLKEVLGKASAKEKPISYCGEQASDILMAAALIGLGVRRFSVAASSIGPFRRLIRSLDVGALSAWLEERLTQSEGSVRRDLSLFLRSNGVAIS